MEAWEILMDNNCPCAFFSSLFSFPAKDIVIIGDIPICDKCFRAVEKIIAAVSPQNCIPKMQCIRSAARLCQAKCPNSLSGNNIRKVALLLLFCAHLQDLNTKKSER